MPVVAFLSISEVVMPLEGVDRSNRLLVRLMRNGAFGVRKSPRV